MQIRLIAVDKLREPYVAAACEDFARRIRPYYAFETLEVKPGRGTPTAVMADEAARILKMIDPGAVVWLLERQGEQVDSTQLADRLEQAADAGAKRLDLVVAGTYGAGESLKQRAGFLWSLSKLTFLHEWARAIALEQMYRAIKIARNEPYHH